MKLTANHSFLILAILCLPFTSCKEHQIDLFANVKGTYFSIKKFSLDEWTTHAGEPISFQKTIRKNGKIVDSSYTNVEKLDWQSILKVFNVTDISDRKWLGKYTFSQFDDDFDKTHNFMYVANKKDMFTQKLLITMDVNTMKVRGIYIETFESSFWNERTQKLYYEPVKVIQIQQYDKPIWGGEQELVTKYTAM